MKNPFLNILKRNPALVFAITSILSGLIHYAVQIYAARTLSVSQFGEFSAWLAYLSMAQCVCVFVQILSNFWRIQNAYLKRALLLTIVIGFLLTIIYLGSFDKLALATLAVGYSLLLGWLTGQLQIRLQFHALAALTIVLALSKVLIALCYLNNFAEGIYLAFTYASLPAIFLACVVLFKHLQIGSNSSRASSKKDLIFAFIISFYYILIPNIDLIMIDLTQVVEVRDKFAPISLFYKIVFSLLIIAFQILLPYQIRDNEKAAKNSFFVRFKEVKFYQILSTFLLISIASEFLMPLMMSVVMSNSNELPSAWLFLSAMHICLGSYLYLLIQDSSARMNLRSSLSPLFAHLVFFSLIMLSSLAVEHYLILASFVDLLAIMFLKKLAEDGASNS